MQGATVADSSTDRPEADDMNIFVACFRHINFFVSHNDPRTLECPPQRR